MEHAVVVGVDGSPASRHAVDWAAEEAKLRGRPLRVLHAYGWPMLDLPLGPDFYLKGATGRTREEVRTLAERLVGDAAEPVRTANPMLEITTEVSDDLPSTALLAASRDAAVLVLGSRGLGGFTGLLLGSVSVQVATHSRSPVVIARLAGTPGGDIVVGVDGSPLSDVAVGYAFEQAAWRGATLTALHAWWWPLAAERGDMMPLVYDPALLAAEEERVLAEATAGWRAKYPEVRMQRRLIHGRAAPALVAASAGAALTVVGSRGHGGFTGLLLGSVSQQVLHHATSPVAVIHPR